ncbi:MAG: hydroxyacylglutathione hydrolase [Leptolyngbya sp. Prado105]|jgi:hydroxyacylglutathione hydrolase|nr:hydroxyacylglutathione hydrolase [Leptolyngbya sp. Prado105]
MQIYRISALSSNYIFLLYDAIQQIAAIVDPGEANSVLKKVEELGVEVVAILNTHHHWDHVDGNLQVLQRFPNAVVYAGRRDRGRIPGLQVELDAGDRVKFGDREAEVLFLPGHTHGHIAYYFAPVGQEAGELFCGDVLFSAGCGRLKEGTPAEMVDSLRQIRALPDQTRVWCAHEYTLANLEFAVTVDRENPELQARLAEVRSLGSQPTIPADLGLEKRTNPFLRWDTPEIQNTMGKTGAVETFALLRQKKDRF